MHRDILIIPNFKKYITFRKVLSFMLLISLFLVLPIHLVESNRNLPPGTNEGNVAGISDEISISNPSIIKIPLLNLEINTENKTDMYLLYGIILIVFGISLLGYAIFKRQNLNFQSKRSKII